MACGMWGMGMEDELKKCLAGEWYDCHDPVFLEFKARARELVNRYNSLSYEDRAGRREILTQLFGGIGANVSVGNPFICDYGRNIFLGDNVSVNMNCTFVDCNKITVGSNVLISSNVQIYTATHPVELKERLTPGWTQGSGEYFCRTYAMPVSIGDGCWIGGGVIILPGVSIGSGSVVGAGSVVTRDMPEDCVAAGNPCRVLRRINVDKEL